MKSLMSRRELLRFLAAGSAGIALAACQPKEVEKVVTKEVEKVVKEEVEVEKEVTRVVEKEVEAAPEEEVVIRIHTSQGDQWYGWWNKAWEENVAGWKSEHPNITLEFEPVPGWGEQYFPVIFSRLAADTLGDIVWQRQVHRSNLSWALEYDIVIDLMPIIEAKDYDLGQFYPGVVEQSTWEGAFYYMPLTSEPTTPVIGYNKSLVEEMGVGEPEDDWDYMQLTEWAQEVTTDDVWGFHTAHLRDDTVGGTPQFRQFGAKMTSDDGKVFLPEEKDVEAIEKVYEWRYDLIHTYEVMPSIEAEFNPQDMLVAGKLVSMCCWPVMLGRLPTLVGDKFDVGWTYTPLDEQGAERRSRLHEHIHGVTTASEHPEEAFEVLAFHSSREFAIQGLLAGMGSTVGRPDFFEDERTLRILPNLRIITPIMKEIEPDFLVANYRGSEVEREFRANADLILMDKVGVEEGVANIKQACQDVLDKPMA